MPQSEFFCHTCKKPFSKTLTPTEYKGKVVSRAVAAKKWSIDSSTASRVNRARRKSRVTHQPL